MIQLLIENYLHTFILFVLALLLYTNLMLIRQKKKDRESIEFFSEINDKNIHTVGCLVKAIEQVLNNQKD